MAVNRGNDESNLQVVVCWLKTGFLQRMGANLGELLRFGQCVFWAGVVHF